MTRIAVLGATGSLGSQVARLAVQAGHEVSVLVRAPSKLRAEVAGKAAIVTADLMAMSQAQLAGFVDGHDVVISCAGLVTEGQGFVDLVDRIVSAVESLPAQCRPLCWFLAGAGLLEIDATGRRGLDLPKVRTTYWPHRANFERLQRSSIDWQLLCPGPMVDQPALGLERLRTSVERLPVTLPAIARLLPGALVLPLFASKIPQMIIPYADAAAFMLAHLERGGPMLRKRVGLALPQGMKGSKQQWTAQAPRVAAASET